MPVHFEQKGQARNNRYSRQKVLEGFGEEGQRRLEASKAVIVGVGALGTAISSCLVRAGTGAVRLIDRDFVEMHNLQRQSLFDEKDIADDLPKAEAAARKLRQANSLVEVEAVVTDVTSGNVESLIADADVVLDGTDNLETRMLLNEAALKLKKPWIYGGVVSTRGMQMTFLPGKGPCFRCLLPGLPPPGSVETCETAGVLGPLPQVIGALQATEALKILTGNIAQVCRELRFIDLWNGRMENLRVEKPETPCPTCDLGITEFLDNLSGSRSEVLCGRKAVQISARGHHKIDFSDVAKRLSRIGAVSFNEHMLRFSNESCEIVLFPDSRAIVKGTDNPALARSFYSRYVGF